MRSNQESGYRCIPVVDNEDFYKGMIYKVHLIEYIYEDDGDENVNIDHLLKHQDDIHNRTFLFLKCINRN